MALLAPPTFNPSSTSTPIEFIFTQTNANPLLFCRASVIIAGTQVDVEVPPFSSAAPNYLFRIDAKRIVKELLASNPQALTTVFSDLNTPYSASNPDLYADIGLIVQYFEQDPITGKPVNSGLTDVVPFGTNEALAIQRQITDDLALTEFTQVGKRFLTNQPNPYAISSTDNLFLTYLGFFINGIRVTTFDSSGTLIDSGITTIPISFTQEPKTFGVGLPQLDGVTYSFGSVNALDPNIASYTIEAGIQFAGGLIFIPLTEVRTYTISRPCDRRSLRIHFLNRLAGGDAFTFTAAKIRSETTNSKFGKIPLAWDYTATPPRQTYSKGRFKYDITANEVYEVESKFYSENEALWIAELISSSETYIEQNGQLVACIVENVPIEQEDIDRLLTVRLRVSLAVDRFLIGN